MGRYQCFQFGDHVKINKGEKKKQREYQDQNGETGKVTCELVKFQMFKDILYCVHVFQCLSQGKLFRSTLERSAACRQMLV